MSPCYVDLPGVQIAESRIPPSLRELVPFARRWSILGDDALEQAIHRASKREITLAVEAAKPLKTAIWDFAYRSSGSSATPVPHEVVLFQMFAWSLQRLEVEASC